MNTIALREELHQLINNVSDENLPSVYQAVDTVITSPSNWWENKDIIRDFDSRVRSWLAKVIVSIFHCKRNPTLKY